MKKSLCLFFGLISIASAILKYPQGVSLALRRSDDYDSNVDMKVVNFSLGVSITRAVLTLSCKMMVSI